VVAGVRVTVDLIVQTAMTEEAEPFLELADSVGDEQIVAGNPHRTLKFGGRSIALVVGGIGFVNAAHAATVAIGRYGSGVPLISAGTAGGLSPDTRVGDVIISTDLINLDADARAFGYARGQVPGMPPLYRGDEALAAKLLAGDHGQPARLGGIGSGEKFVTADLAITLRQDFPTVDAVDMESVAIAQIAHKYSIPFVSVRAISDLCAPDGDEFLAHLDSAAINSCRVVISTLL
jgi:adenosylhomocysteine nucleosidase